MRASDSDAAPSDSRLSYSLRKGSGLGHFTIDNNGKSKLTNHTKGRRDNMQIRQKEVGLLTTRDKRWLRLLTSR